MLPLLDEAYIKTGKLQFVYKEFPVIGGEAAVMASVAAQCAGVQGQFWSMHDWLYANGNQWRSGDTLANLKAAAPEIQLDREAFANCIDNQETRDSIVIDYQEGRRFGVRGTPNFVINGHIINGAVSADQFTQIIDALLQEAESGALPANVATVTPTPTPDTDFAVETVTVKGDPDAPVTMVEFSDFQCPFCQRYFLQTYPKLVEKYVDTGKVRYIFKDFPLTSIHPQAVVAANAAHCAGQQEAYWAMHDKLYEGQSRWSGNSKAGEVFKDFASELGLDIDQFNACLEAKQFSNEIFADLQEGIAAGVTGTPAFFINGVFISGARPYEDFEQVIEQQLGQ